MKVQLVAGLVALAIAAEVASAAAQNGEFPFDRELILDVQPMRPAKRRPMITVEPNGNAVIDLWCRTVTGHVEIDADSIRITPAPLPPDLPAMMAPGQCAPERIAADETVLEALSRMTGWRQRGAGVELIGPQSMVFRPATN
jgi:hypothetical protein